MREIVVESQRRPEARRAPGPASGLLLEFETVYRANFDVVTAFFARRSTDPQTVADLTSETFVQAIVSFPTFDPGKGTARAWVIGIARRVFAKHCESTSRNREMAMRLSGYRELDVDEAAELAVRIDAERDGRGLLDAMTSLPALDREVVELVDLVGMKPREAAVALGVSSGALRIRLFRARNTLRALVGRKKGQD
ncbi:RNA polymerase sigma factor [Virgisporangium aurantiacum]|uniref:RNA polymerase sigma factor n=1 Tax=Virgisporangium aurantiacum TaxID=175570 RepID=UPI00194E547A|nr:RNA polymerase sigma factor [Virgisporangium aurantiacum]